MAGNYTVIKCYGDNYYSVTQLKRGKPEGRPECSENDTLGVLGESVEGSAPEQKLRESLVRSRSRIFEIAMCNNWELFATFTIDPKRYDRYNLEKYYKDFTRFIRYQREKYGLEIKYLLIPECHKDGAWHMHGLFMGLPVEHLCLFTLEEKLPHYIRNKLKKGFEVFDWLDYRWKFGFCDLEHIRNKEACCKYIVKYITKDLQRSVKEINANVYYCSQNLERAVVVYSGEDSELIALPDCSNIFMERKDFFTFAEAFEYSSIQFYDSFINSGLDDDTIQKILAG